MILTNEQRTRVWEDFMRNEKRRDDPVVVDKSTLLAQVGAVDDIIEANQTALMASAIGVGLTTVQVVELYRRVIAAREEVL